MRRTFLIAAMGMVAASCAQPPDAIAPAYVSTVPYKSWTCQQLSEETVRLQQALATASGQQTQARGNDVAGVILLGLPVSTLSGENIAPQIANLKGQRDAIAQTMIRKNCSQVATAPPPQKAMTAPAH